MRITAASDLRDIMNTFFKVKVVVVTQWTKGSRAGRNGGQRRTGRRKSTARKERLSMKRK